MKKRVALLLMTILALCLSLGCGGKKQSSAEQQDGETLRLAAAASLERVFAQRLIPEFTAKHPHVKLEAAYDASGRLQKQIEQGFEADIFISAAPKQMQALQDKGYVTQENMKPLLENKLVLIVPAQGDSRIKSFADFKLAKQPAIGDPKSVPAGQYAQEALTSLHQWELLEKRLSLGTNVVQVLNWVAEGSADAGLVYASDAATNKRVRVVAETPTGSLKQKVIYPLGVLQKARKPQLAKEFADFLSSAEAAKAFQEYGFTVAQEEGSAHERKKEK